MSTQEATQCSDVQTHRGPQEQRGLKLAKHTAAFLKENEPHMQHTSTHTSKGMPGGGGTQHSNMPILSQGGTVHHCRWGKASHR